MSSNPQILPPDVFAKRLGNRLRDIRNERGLSQAQAAARAGLDPSTYWHYEQGQSRSDTPLNAKIYNLFKLAAAFEIDLPTLVDIDNDIEFNIKAINKRDEEEAWQKEAKRYSKK